MSRRCPTCNYAQWIDQHGRYCPSCEPREHTRILPAQTRAQIRLARSEAASRQHAQRRGEVS